MVSSFLILFYFCFALRFVSSKRVQEVGKAKTKLLIAREAERFDGT